MEDTLVRLGATIQTALPASVTAHEVVRGELTIHAKAAAIVKVATFLRDDPGCQFICIIDVTAVDYPGREQRFDVVYHFLSPRLNQRIRVKAMTDETTGAVIAAPTTSLPEDIGGVRNWDYRYCWLRDTYYVITALNHIGHFEEMEKYFG